MVVVKGMVVVKVVVVKVVVGEMLQTCTELLIFYTGAQAAGGDTH